MVTNSCNTVITPVEQPIDSVFDGCSGHVTYSWLYNDCTNEHPHTWSFTYNIHDTIAPTFTVPTDISICRQYDGSVDTSTSNTGTPSNLNDNCLTNEELSIVYYDSSTSHIQQQDTIFRTWTVSDNCQSTTSVQRIYINPVKHITISNSICQGASFLFGGETLTEGGVYHDTVQTALGCDSITTLTLTVDEILRDTVDVSICHGGSYHFGNTDLTVAGTYSDTTQTLAGCDSITVLNLTVEDYLRDTINVSICQGATYHFGNADLTVAGTYSDTTALPC